jgi:GDPmannose 4,6-dehydratase
MESLESTRNSRTAIITGVTGQDGWYLANHLLATGYHVIGLVRPESYLKLKHAQLSQPDLYPADIEYRAFDVNCESVWERLLEETAPDELYHLAGISFVPDSWKMPVHTIETNVVVTSRILEAIRVVSPMTKLFYACSSEIFGRPEHGPQNENTPVKPVSPYGVTKAASYSLIDTFRNQYGLFACSGILFNHESPRRPLSFVTRKISAAAAAIANGQQDSLMLGNIESRRDWGYAGDFVDCMHRTLQASEARDYVIGTGIHTTVRELLDCAFDCVGLDWNKYLSIDPRFARANDVQAPLADSTLARERLGWTPTTTIRELMRLMVENDLQICQQQTTQRRAA